MAPVVLQVVVFRYVPPGEGGGIDAEGLDALNDALVVELQASGCHIRMAAI